MDTAEMRELAPGTMLDDKYRIERLLAVGGMGAVYEGTHVKIRKRVAIKVLNPQLSTPAMVERFNREAITASQIGHEGIAQTTDLGTSSRGEPFLVMEFLDGESLATRLKAHGALPIEVACELTCAILAPLAAAHHAGIVHRDLKPDNVFLVRQSRGEMVKLLDFGISRTTGIEGEFRLTTTGLVLGTPYYMSPEQARGDTQITPAADLYAVGVILYEMLTGAVPISADNYNQLMYRVMTGEYPPPRAQRPDLSVELEQLIQRTMALDPRNRPASAAELEHALLAFCRPTFREHTIERISATAMPRSHAPSQAPAFSASGTDRTLLAKPSGMRSQAQPLDGPTSYAPANHAPKRSRALLVVLLLAAAGIGGTVFVVTRGKDTPTGVAAVTPEPTKPKPADTKPVDTKPVDTKPVDTKPVDTKPVDTKPVDTKPVDTKPVDTKPVNTQPAAKPAAPATITLQFVVEPATARILVDGKLIAGTELTVPKDGAIHTLKIAARGFRPHTANMKFDVTQRLSIQLIPRAGGLRRPRGKGTSDRIDSTSPYQP